MDLHGQMGSGVTFLQTEPRVPRPWVNRLWNVNYQATCSHVAQGMGFIQDAEGRRTEFHKGRMVYVRDADTGEWWTANGLPLPRPGEPWSCAHAGGVTTISREASGVATRFAVLVPRDFDGEWWRIEVENRSGRRRRMQVIPMLDVALGGWFAGAVRVRFDAKGQALFGSDVVRTGTHYAHYTDGREVRMFMGMDPAPDGFDTRRQVFIGPYDTIQNPAAMREGGCRGSVAMYESPLFALQATLDLRPGEARTVIVTAGFDAGDDSAAAMRRAQAPRAFASEEAAIRREVEERGKGWEVTFPENDVACFANGWLKHQLRFNSTWARVYYNGFRDLCQDLAALAALDPEFARERLERVLAHQYASGFAPRAWVSGQLVEQDYADSPVWIAPAVHAVAAETGDAGWFAKQIPFTDGTTSSVYDHVFRSLRYMVTDTGPHGLSLIRKGDWNDLLNAVGKEHRGESVWLSQAVVVALEDGAALARAAGREADAEWSGEAAAQLRGRINAVARVGDAYVRAFTDDGLPVGAPGSAEGIDVLPQAWAVLSGCVEGDDARRVMETVDRLLETPMGTKTMERGFDRFRADIGFQSVVPPDFNTNGGYYNHAGGFAVAADFAAGRPDAAWRRLRKLLPWTEARGRITGEPFVINNGYHGPRAGQRAGDSDTGWITGTAGWVCRALIEGCFGLRPTMEGLRVRPCLPSSWSEVRVVRRFRGTTYEVEYTRGGESGGKPIVQADGVDVGDGVLPQNPGKRVKVKVRV
jgi:cellobiose phosphorylase